MVPFTTTWTGKSDFAQMPTAIYAFVLFMCAVSYWMLERCIVASEGEQSILKKAIGKDLKGKISVPMYALAVLASFVSSPVSFLILTAMAGLWFFPDAR